MNVVITIPAYNEERDLGKAIADVKSVMSKTKHQFTVLVIDDGSTDNTVSVAKKSGAKVVSNKRNVGLAETFKREMQESIKLKPDVIVHTDADGQYPAKYIPGLLKKFEQGHDLVLGTRFGKGKYVGSWTKSLGNQAFAQAFTRLLGQRITDTTTGFRAFSVEVAELPLINRFTYTQEQLIRAAKANMAIAEVPITTNKTRKSRLFRNSFDYALKAWINILRIYRDFEPLKFFGKVGLSFVFLGVLVGMWILYTIITTGSAGGIPRVILSMLLLLLGVQIILFGFLADMRRE